MKLVKESIKNFLRFSGRPSSIFLGAMVSLLMINSGMSSAGGRIQANMIPVFAYFQNCYPPEHRVLVIVVDGLRPDYVEPSLMPNLYALGEQGVFGNKHSAAFPTKTYVNSASIATGSYPDAHGLMGNQLYIPAFQSNPFSAGSAGNLRNLDSSTNGNMLTAISAGEILSSESSNCLFMTGSSGSGASLLQNHRETGHGIWTHNLFVPSTVTSIDHESDLATVGDPPTSDDVAHLPNYQRETALESMRTEWATSVFLHFAKGSNPPAVSIIWIHEVDGANHDYGVGSLQSLAAAGSVDAQVGRIVSELGAANLDEKFNIFVTADHGFSQGMSGGLSISSLLESQNVDDIVQVVDGNQLYILEENVSAKNAIRNNIVRALQLDYRIGNIYTKPASSGSKSGVVPGTLSFNAIEWHHDRSADIVFSPAWNSDTTNSFFPGKIWRGNASRGYHGSDSPYDLNIKLVAAGPDIKSGVTSNVPTGNVDIMPTVIHLLGLEKPDSMEGRVLTELLVGGPSPTAVSVANQTYQASTMIGNLSYKAEMKTQRVGSTVYLQGAKTTREYVLCQSLSNPLMRLSKQNEGEIRCVTN